MAAMRCNDMCFNGPRIGCQLDSSLGTVQALIQIDWEGPQKTEVYTVTWPECSSFSLLLWAFHCHHPSWICAFGDWPLASLWGPGDRHHLLLALTSKES